MVKASQTVLAYTKAPVSSADTEITIRGLQDIYGIQAVMQGSVMYGTIEPRSSTNQEIISFTNIVVVDANTVRLTGCTRGLKAQDSETGTARDHGANVEFILSNNPQFYDTFAALDEEETITEEWTFIVSPIVPTPTTGQQAVNKDFAEGLANQGAADASTTTKGISRLSASPTTTLGTATVTIASPAVVTLASHGLTANDTIEFTTTGALPTGLLPSVTYYVISAGLTSSEFRLALTLGGTAINTTGSQSGTHTLFKTTPVAVGVNDTKMLTQDENNAAAGAGGSPSSTNLFETQYDTSNGSTKTATTISFAAGTKTIADSGNGFVTAGFKQGTQITVTGSASNNGTYTIVSVAAGAIVIAETLVNESAGATVIISTVKADKIVRYDANGEITGQSTAAFGDGSDGAVTFDGAATILGMAPAANVYTMTRDIYLTNCTINSGVFINTAGYRIFGTGTLTNSGTIRNNGGNGGNATNSSAGVSGTVGAAGTAPSSVTVFASGGAGTAGALGKNTNGAGIASTNPTSVTNSVAGAGGTGGAGGQGGGNAGGAAGTSTATTAGTNGLRDLVLAQVMYTVAGVIKAGTGGGGAGGGGVQETGSIGTGFSGAGGGGGGAGGVVYVAFKNVAGSGSITATGGTGGNGGNAFLGSATNTGFGGGGAGGGGAGGVVIVITRTATNPMTLSAAGGTGGTGGTLAQVGSVTTSTNGSNGSNGATGVTCYFVI